MQIPEIDANQLAMTRESFFQRGEDVASWARSRGFKPASVYRLLAGQSKARRGVSHKVAVALGLKRGDIDAVGLPTRFGPTDEDRN